MSPCTASVSPILEDLLQRVAPGAVPAALIDAEAQTSIRYDGLELPVVMNGATRTLLHVAHAGTTAFAAIPKSLLVLRIVVSGGELRVDLPVEVVTCGRTSLVLRVLASPLVLRRRMVRDSALAEALGVPTQPVRRAAPLVA